MYLVRGVVYPAAVEVNIHEAKTQFSKRLQLALAGLIAVLLLPACAHRRPLVVADAIYFGGPIVTVNDAQPSAQALAVKDGKVLALGAEAEIERLHEGSETRWVDLGGKTLVPGFIDGHAHVLAFGAQAVGANLLAPPDGDVDTIEDIVRKLREFAQSPDVGRTGWIFGIGYDDALIGRHPTRDDLDKVSKDVPVIAVHISGHFSAMNSAGLAAIGYTAATKDPEGGVIRRRAGSREPNGVLEELAAIPLTVGALTPSKPEDRDYFLRKGLARGPADETPAEWPCRCCGARTDRHRRPLVRRLRSEGPAFDALVRKYLRGALPGRRHEDNPRRLDAWSHRVAHDSVSHSAGGAVPELQGIPCDPRYDRRGRSCG
jgi:hypothetical protein